MNDNNKITQTLTGIQNKMENIKMKTKSIYQ